MVVANPSANRRKNRPRPRRTESSWNCFLSAESVITRGPAWIVSGVTVCPCARLAKSIAQAASTASETTHRRSIIVMFTIIRGERERANDRAVVGHRDPADAGKNPGMEPQGRLHHEDFSVQGFSGRDRF